MTGARADYQEVCAELDEVCVRLMEVRKRLVDLDPGGDLNPDGMPEFQLNTAVWWIRAAGDRLGRWA